MSTLLFQRGKTWWVDLRRYGQGRRSLETRDRAEAKVRARAAERAAWEYRRLGPPKDRTGPTIAEAFATAMQQHGKWKYAKGASTIRIHFAALKAQFGDMTRLSCVTREHVIAWVAMMEAAGLSGSTINARLTILRVLRDVHDMVPLKMPPQAPSRRRERVVSDSELQAMATQLEPATRALVLFLRETGARLGEALAARGEQIDHAIPALVLPTSKNGKPRAIPLTRTALAVLAGRPAAGLLWPGLTGSVVAKRWASARAAIGVTDPDFVVHALRHTKATELTTRFGIAVAKAWLGHSSLATTDRYAHLDIKEIITLEGSWTREQPLTSKAAVLPPAALQL